MHQRSSLRAVFFTGVILHVAEMFAFPRQAAGVGWGYYNDTPPGSYFVIFRTNAKYRHILTAPIPKNLKFFSIIIIRVIIENNYKL
jgi:hypothetical protein